MSGDEEIAVSIPSQYTFAQVPASMIRSDMEASTIKVWGGLWLHGQNPGNCYPKQRTLAAECSLSVATVKRAIATLIDLGHIVVERDRRADGSLGVNHYQLHPVPVPRDHQGSPMSYGQGSSVSYGQGSPMSPQEIDPSINRRESDAKAPLSTAPQLSLLSEEDREALRVARQLADHLADHVTANPPDSKRPRVTDTWVQHVDYLIRLDGRSPEQVRNCIDWVFTDPAGDFWIKVIRSPKKLREHYDAIRADAIRAGKAPRGKPSMDQVLDELLAEQPQPVEASAVLSSIRAESMLVSALPFPEGDT